MLAAKDVDAVAACVCGLVVCCDADGAVSDAATAADVDADVVDCDTGSSGSGLGRSTRTNLSVMSPTTNSDLAGLQAHIKHAHHWN